MGFFGRLGLGGGQDKEKTQKFIHRIATALYAMRAYGFLDQSRVIDSAVQKAGVAARHGKALSKIIGTKRPLSINDLSSAVGKSGIAPRDLEKLADAFGVLGVSAHGLPVGALTKNRGLLSACLYELATGDFRLTANRYESMNKLEENYKVFFYNLKSKTIEQKILCIYTTQYNDDPNPANLRQQGGNLDSFGKVVEIVASKGKICVRGGSFIPFDRFHVALLASIDKDEAADFIHERLDPNAAALYNAAPLHPEKDLEMLTLQDRGGGEIEGTFQFKEDVGKLIGSKLPRELTSDMVNSVGPLSDTDIANLPTEDQNLIKTLRQLGGPVKYQPSVHFIGRNREAN